MPKFPGIELNAQVQNVEAGPQAPRVDVSSGFRALGQGVQNVGEMLQKRAEQNDISNQDVQLEQYRATKTKLFLEDAQKGKVDKDYAEKFSEEVDTELSMIGESASTRAGSLYFEKNSSAMRTHFNSSVIQAQAALAGEKAVTKYKTRQDAASSAVFSQPGQLRVTLGAMNNYVDELVNTEGLPAQQAIKLRAEGAQHLQLSAALGWAKIEPEQARDETLAGTFDAYLTPAQKEQVLTEAHQELSFRHTKETWHRQEVDRLKKEAQKVTQADFLMKVDNHSLSLNDIRASNLENFGSGSKDTFRRMLTGKVTKADNPVFLELLRQTMLPDGDPRKTVNDQNVMEWAANGKITVNQANTLRKELQGQNTNEGKSEREMKKTFLTQVRMRLRTLPLGMRDPKGDQKFTDFSTNFFPEYYKLRQSGKSAAQLLNSISPDYMANNLPVGTIDEYVNDLAEQIQPAKIIPPALGKEKPKIPIEEEMKKMWGK